jgi:hypothetical protein
MLTKEQINHYCLNISRHLPTSELKDWLSDINRQAQAVAVTAPYMTKTFYQRCNENDLLDEPVSILNFYRNFYYKADCRTTESLLSMAIDDVLPKYIALQEENKRLKATSGTEDYIKLQEENEQLKQVTDTLKRWVDHTKGEDYWVLTKSEVQGMLRRAGIK